GLVVYCGTIVTEEGKEKKVNIDFEPFKPINTSLYLCDNKFHTEVRKGVCVCVCEWVGVSSPGVCVCVASPGVCVWRPLVCVCVCCVPWCVCVASPGVCVCGVPWCVCVRVCVRVRVR